MEHVTHSRQVRRQHERKHGTQLADYYWLTVKPSPDATDMRDIAQPVGHAHRREHVVRGHFRYYHPDRPLFGRYAGMVWIPEHTRGDAGNGIVHKGYMIRAKID